MGEGAGWTVRLMGPGTEVKDGACPKRVFLCTRPSSLEKRSVLVVPSGAQSHDPPALGACSSMGMWVPGSSEIPNLTRSRNGPLGLNSLPRPFSMVAPLKRISRVRIGASGRSRVQGSGTGNTWARSRRVSRSPGYEVRAELAYGASLAPGPLQSYISSWALQLCRPYQVLDPQTIPPTVSVSLPTPFLPDISMSLFLTSVSSPGGSTSPFSSPITSSESI